MTITGSAKFTQTELGTINVLLGTPATTTPASPGTAGLVLSAGKVSALDMTLDSNITTGGLTFSTVGMRMVYDEPNGKYSLSGTSSFNYNSKIISVNFGGADPYFGNTPTAGLVITGGDLKAVDMIVTSSITVGSLAFQADHLRFTQNNSSRVFTMAGNTRFTATGLGTVQATFGTSAANGNPATAGLVMTNGSLTSLDMSITSHLTIGSVNFTTNGLRFAYQSVTDQFQLFGSAGMTVGGIGNLAVTFGYTSTTNGVTSTSPGLVVKNGSLINLDMTINSNMSVGAVVFRTTGLQFTYAQSNQIYTLIGSVGITVGGTANLNAMFGHTTTVNGTTTSTPGLKIVSGNLQSLDLTINADFKVGDVNFGVNDLEFQYQNKSQFPNNLTYTSGTYYAGNYVTDGTKPYNSNNYEFSMSGTAFISVGGMDRLSVTFGHTNTTTNVTTPGLKIINGNLVSLDITINANFKVGAVQFGVNDLEFIYQNTSQFPAGANYVGGTYYTGSYLSDPTQTGYKAYSSSSYIFGMAGTAYIDVGGMDRLSVTFGHTKADGTQTAGLLIKDGNLAFMDLTINAQFKVGAVTFGVRDLEFVYQNTSQMSVADRNAYVAGTFYTGNYLTGGYDATKYQFGMAGTAFITFGGMSGMSVTLGHRQSDGTQTPGMVIVNGKLESMDVTINADFIVGLVKFGVQDLNFTFQNTSQIPDGVTYTPGTFNRNYDTNKPYNTDARSMIFTVAGTGYVTVGGLNRLSVTFGHLNSDGSRTQGLVIVGGNLESIDVTINANFVVSGVNFGVQDLEFIYQNTSQIPDTIPTGAYYTPGTVYRGPNAYYDTTQTYDGASYSFSMSGTAFITVGTMSLSVTFGHRNREDRKSVV
jgi:hypothetical protein